MTFNPASWNLKCGPPGSASWSLYNAAGPTAKIFEEECRKKVPKGLQAGEVIATDAGALPSQVIIHGMLGKWGASQSLSEATVSI